MEIPFDKLNRNSYGKESRKMIDEWKERAYQLEVQQDFIGHPFVKTLSEITNEYIQTIDQRLQNDEDITELERKLLFREKKVHQIYLSIFNEDCEGELQQIANNVNAEL